MGLKRTRLKRKTELQRSGTPMRAKKAGKPRRRTGACRPYLGWLKTQECRITGARNGEIVSVEVLPWGSPYRHAAMPIVVDPAHVRTKRLGGDLWNAISLAHHLHEEQHRIGIKSFTAKYCVDLKAAAIAQTEQWLATPEGQQWAASHPGCAERGGA